MRYLTLLLTTLSLLTSGIIVSHAQSQAEMNLTAAGELNDADAKLNSVYQRVLSKNADDKAFCADLKEAQRAWIKFVDFHMKTVFPLKEGESPRYVYGSIYPSEFAAEKIELFQQRIKQLESLLPN